MFFGILGTLLVEADGPGPVAIPGAKERLLLARLLICPGHAVAVETLVEDVWDRTPPPTARKSLQAHVVRLRSALEPDRPGGSPGRFVVRRGDGYAIVVDPDDIDARVLTSTAASGRAALASGAPDRARRLLTGAEALWRGDPLADWPDADWAAAERTRLTEVRVCVLQARLDAELALGRHREVVPELEALVTQQPLHEGWWTRLMLALYRSDRQSEALAAGRRARAVLVEELGLDAGPGLRGMEHAILRQDESLIPSATQPPTWRTGPPLASQACPYRGLAAYRPQDAAVFCGRGAAVRALISKIRTAELVVVSGPSGAGKSSLVRAGLPIVTNRTVRLLRWLYGRR